MEILQPGLIVNAHWFHISFPWSFANITLSSIDRRESRTIFFSDEFTMKTIGASKTNHEMK